MSNKTLESIVGNFVSDFIEAATDSGENKIAAAGAATQTIVEALVAWIANGDPRKIEGTEKLQFAFYGLVQAEVKTQVYSALEEEAEHNGN